MHNNHSCSHCYQLDADRAVSYLTSGESSLRAIVLYRLTSNEIEQLRNTKIGIRHVALIGNDLEEHINTVGEKTIIVYDVNKHVFSIRYIERI